MFRRFSFVLLAFAAWSCASYTTIDSSWTDETHADGPFHRLAVVALFATAAESRTFEETAGAALAQRGVDTVLGHTILEDGVMYEQDELRRQFAQANVDGILIYRLIAVDERQVYRPPTPYMHVPSGLLRGDPFYWYYYPSWSYYWYWRSSLDVTRSPGYWEELSFVVVEASLYDASRDRLVWTAKTSTLDGAAFQSLSESIANAVTRQLVAKDVVAAPERAAAAAPPARAAAPVAN